ncbi:MAG: hypothetical protein IJQ73_13010 [Kiritimatiellae bacterium]|nr:hypothetical protein [Kiritimatiellia bacterium]
MAKAAYSVALVPTKIEILKPAEPAEGRRRRVRQCLRDGEFPDGMTLRGFLRDFLEAHIGTATVNTDQLSGFRVASLSPETPNARILSGYVETGKYGFESELVDVNDTTRTKRRERTDCEFIPFFFAADFENGRDGAILLTEQFGPYSPKAILLEQLREHVRGVLPDHKVRTETIVSDDIVKAVLSKHVKAIRFHYDQVPPDVADNLDENVSGHIEREGLMEVSFKSRNGVFPEWGFEFLNNVRRTGLTINDATSTDMKVDMEVDGRIKTVNVGNLESYNTSFIVDSQEDVQENGHPGEERMLSEAADAFSICRRALGWPARRIRGRM